MNPAARIFIKSLSVLGGLILGALPFAECAPVRLSEEAPTTVTRPASGVILVDFGNVAFGNLRLIPPAGAKGKLRVHFGEATKSGRIDRKPPGTVRYASAEIEIDGKPIVVAPPADPRNTKQPAAVLTPPEWGVVLPFRWVEIEGWPGDFKPANAVRQAGYLAAWNDSAAAFESSDKTLDRIWDLCRHSIKATTFAGIYVDGDRERIPYEADAYLNQLSHYATDNDLEMARDSFDRLMKNPTWPSEWAPHMVFMAHADWMRTGDAKWLSPRYESLKSKLLMERVGGDGWVRSDKKQQGWNDIVDWPQAERDGFEFREVNTVVNAFHLAALAKMADLARAVGKSAEADDYAARFKKGREQFNAALFMEEKAAYRDGIGSEHASSHAGLFPLAFGLVPEENAHAVAANLAKRGMTCSVYAAQYLLEGLFQSGAGRAAMDLILAKGDRSWRHMLDSGTTITWEAWDQKYKPNQDWNHAWGAAPANLLPRFVLGAEPLTAGWETARIRPSLSGLTEAQGKIPTPRGPVSIHWIKNSAFNLKIELPPGMTAMVEIPAADPSSHVWVDGKETAATLKGGRLCLTPPLEGSRVITVK
ncbi:MAG: alpha-L-rhamnosidase C-terminal domain-containing protein [Luteolibacter sp.]